MHTMERLNILVGGPEKLWPEELQEMKISGPWLGVDRGALRLLNLGVKPLVAIGDFDSINQVEQKTVNYQLNDIRVAQPEKDDTDTQLALTIAMQEFNPEEIYLYGATGGRIDHFLANMWMITEPRYATIVERLRIIDRGNSVRFYLPGEHELQKEADKKYLAFVNLTPVKNLTLIDEKYPLYNWSSDIPRSWASNEFSGNVNRFKFDAGIIAVIQARDLQGSI